MSVLLAHLRYFVSDALDEWRHSPGPNVLATATLSAVLFVAGLNLLLLSNLSARVGSWKSELRVSVYIVDGAEPGEVEAVRARIAALPGVEAVVHVDKDEALRRFRRSFADLAEVPSELGANPLPASLEVELASGPRARDTARDIGAAVAGSTAVEEVRYDRSFLDRVDGLLDIARWGGGALGAVVLTAVGFVVGGVLRLSVHARRDEIEIMHLVGAAPMLVRGPFLVAGLVQGLMGGGLAVFLVEAARRAARTYAGDGSGAFDLLAGDPLPLGPACLIAGIGGSLGVIAAWFAVREARETAR